jgi:hypothetical protein
VKEDHIKIKRVVKSLMMEKKAKIIKRLKKIKKIFFKQLRE